MTEPAIPVARCRLVAAPGGGCRVIVDCCPHCRRSHVHDLDEPSDLVLGYVMQCGASAYRLGTDETS